MLEAPVELSVVIPAYNEESVIAATLRDVVAYCKKKFSSYEVIVVDDGSSDETAREVASVSGVRLIGYRHNHGKGYAVRSGVLASSGSYILFMDADNSTNVRELGRFIPELRECDIVIGSRGVAGSNVTVSQNFVKRSLGRLGNRLIRALLGLSLTDTQCGFKLFKKNARGIFEKQIIQRWGFDFEILYLAHRSGMKIKELPVTWINNFQSKVKPLSYLSTLLELFRVHLRYRLGKYR